MDAAGPVKRKVYAPPYPSMPVADMAADERRQWRHDRPLIEQARNREPFGKTKETTKQRTRRDCATGLDWTADYAGIDGAGAGADDGFDGGFDDGFDGGFDDGSSSSDDDDDDDAEYSYPTWVRVLRRSRRARRGATAAVLVVLCLWTYWLGWARDDWRQHRAASVTADSLAARMMGAAAAVGAEHAAALPMLYGANETPRFAGLTTVKHWSGGLAAGARLVLVGDVHGCADELRELLERVAFNVGQDRLVLTGDLVSRGPDSAAVVDLARRLSAACVRGNHEDQILLLRDQLRPSGGGSSSSSKNNNDNNNDSDNNNDRSAHGSPPAQLAPRSVLPGPARASASDEALSLARHLSDENIEYLRQCPVILSLGDAVPGIARLVVVHAGLVPGLPLEKQDPYMSMNMRTIDLGTAVPSILRDGVGWEKLWNRVQQKLPEHQRTTVVYGHNARRGLNLRKYSKGIDTGCARGGKLTALIIEQHPRKEHARYRHVSVRCRRYTS